MTREELWLAAIAGLDGVNPPDYPVWHYEQMLAAIYDAVVGASPAREFPARSWHLDEILYAVYCAAAGLDDPGCPAPTCRIEEFWYGIYQAAAGDESASVPTPIWRIEEFLAGIFDVASEWGASVLTETGNAPLTLANAVARAIHSLTQTGLCSQASTPTPSSPVDIVCNNGALKMVDDELPDGYKRVLGFTCNNNAMWEITGFKLRGSDTVRVSFSVTASCNVWGCYQGTSDTDNYDLYVGTVRGAKYLRYGNGTYPSYWSDDDLNQRFDVVFTPTGTTGMPQDSTWTAATFESANDLLIGSTAISSTSAKLKGKLYGNFIVENGGVERLHLVPCERLSDSVLGYYDLVGEAFYEPYTGFSGAVSLGYDGSHYHLQTVGTPEVLTVTDADSNTQTVNDVSNLLAVGDYADTEELIAGIRTGKVGVYVCTGEEPWGAAPATGVYQISVDTIDGITTKDTACLCTHFVGLEPKTSAANMTDLSCKCGDNNNSNKTKLYIRYNDMADATALKAYLAAEYAAGHPVMVFYPLATETTTQTTAHALTTAEGTNTVSVTAEVSPVALECEYYGTGS